MMQEKLSRELRDMVYEALLGEPENYYVDNEEFGSGHYYSAKIVVDNLHVGDKTFVGEETLTELAEMWYRHSVFKLQGDSDVACLFRNKTWRDLPDLDTTRWIRHVYMQVTPRDFTAGMEKTLEAGEELVLPSDFEQLAKLEHPATFTIGISFEHWYYHGETRKGKKFSVDLMSRRVFPVLKQLIASGVGVAVQIDESEPVKVGLEHLDSEGWSKLARGAHLRQ